MPLAHEHEPLLNLKLYRPMMESFFFLFIWAIASDLQSLENSFKNKAHTVQFCFGVIMEDDMDIDVNLVSIVALLS